MKYYVVSLVLKYWKSCLKFEIKFEVTQTHTQKKSVHKFTIQKINKILLKICYMNSQNMFQKISQTNLQSIFIKNLFRSKPTNGTIQKFWSDARSLRWLHSGDHRMWGHKSAPCKKFEGGSESFGILLNAAVGGCWCSSSHNQLAVDP